MKGINTMSVVLTFVNEGVILKCIYRKTRLIDNFLQLSQKYGKYGNYSLLYIHLHT
jgi:hypothetical protein